MSFIIKNNVTIALVNPQALCNLKFKFVFFSKMGGGHEILKQETNDLRGKLFVPCAGGRKWKSSIISCVYSDWSL